MKKLMILLLLLFSLLGAEVLDKIVAKVGREIILKSELDEYLKYIRTTGTIPEDITDIDILNNMIESKLIIQKAKAENFEIDEYKIKEKVDEQIKKIISNYPDEASFKRELTQAGLTISDLKENYHRMVTESYYKEEILRNNIRGKVYITEVEIEEYYNDHKDEFPKRPEMFKIGMILKEIQPSTKTKAQALEDIRNVMDKIKAGESFAELATTESQCPSSKNGGDLGFFVKGTMIKSFEDAAFNLHPGEISDIVETDFGYHIIKMEEKKDDEIRVRHILKLVEATENDIEETVKTMEEVLVKLRKGGNFGELANEYSDDDSTAANGGIIGEFSADNYPEIFKEKIENIKVGEYSELVRESNYIYIFGKLDKVVEREYNYQEIQERIRDIVTSEKEKEVYDNFIKKLMEETYIEILYE